MFSEQYEVTHDHIGSGGHGSVVIAISPTSQRQVACKVVDLHRYSVQLLDDVFNSKVYRDQTEDELKMLEFLIVRDYQRRLRHELGKYQREHTILEGLSHVRYDNHKLQYTD